MAEAPREPRVSYAVPSGGRVLIDNRTGEQTAWLPLWMYWIQIGHRYADAADALSKKEQPLGLIKAREVTTAGGPIAGPEGNVEMIEAMVTIVASATCNLSQRLIVDDSDYGDERLGQMRTETGESNQFTPS